MTTPNIYIYIFTPLEKLRLNNRRIENISLGCSNVAMTDSNRVVKNKN